MTEIYVKTTEPKFGRGNVQIECHQQKGLLTVRLVCESYNQSSEDRVYKVSSPFYSRSQIFEILREGEWCYKLPTAEAYLLCKTLDPDRQIEDPETQEMVDYSFEMCSVAQAKADKIQEISWNTEDLIYEGYQWDGKMFPLEKINQQYWGNVKTQLDAGLITEDFGTTTMEGELYTIPVEDLDDFLNGLFNLIVSIKQDGRVFKNSAFNASTIQDIASIVDTRIRTFS